MTAAYCPIKRANEDNTWIVTYTGRHFWPVAPHVYDVNIFDIAHALAHTCRWSGHCREFYSVAQHSVLVANWVEQEGCDRDVVLAGLLHDASEAYINDIARPTKPLLAGYKDIEARLMAVICEKFGLHESHFCAAVHYADNVLLHTEARDLVTRTPVKWMPTDAEMLGFRIKPWAPKAAETAFLTLFGRLTNDRLGIMYRHGAYRARDLKESYLG